MTSGPAAAKPRCCARKRYVTCTSVLHNLYIARPVKTSALSREPGELAPKRQATAGPRTSMRASRRTSSASTRPAAPARRRRLRRVSHRVPRRVLVPFLLFWCLGSFALGQEAARAPLLAIVASAVGAIEHSPLAAHAGAPRTRAHTTSSATAPRVPLIAAGSLGVKPPTVALPARPGRHARHKRLTQIALRVRGSGWWSGIGVSLTDFPSTLWLAVYPPTPPWVAFPASIPSHAGSTWMPMPPCAGGM
jgi:hypothetical protein